MASSRISSVFINNLLIGRSVPGLCARAITLNLPDNICTSQDSLSTSSVSFFLPVWPHLGFNTIFMLMIPKVMFTMLFPIASPRLINPTSYLVTPLILNLAWTFQPDSIPPNPHLLLKYFHWFLVREEGRGGERERRRWESKHWSANSYWELNWQPLGACDDD